MTRRVEAAPDRLNDPGRRTRIDALVIEALALDDSLGAERLAVFAQRLVEAEADRDIYREIAREAMHVLHAKHLRLLQLERRLIEINAERRRAAA